MSNAPTTHSADGMQQSSSTSCLNVLQACLQSKVGRMIRNCTQRQTRMRNACMCGLFSCQTVEGLWAEGGSLGTMAGESIVISENAFYGDCLRLFSVENTIVVTDRRFIVKKVWKIGPCNIQAEEASHHFSNLQHVGVERGLYLEGAFTKWLTIRLLLLLAIILLAIGQRTISIVLFVLFGNYGLYNLVMILINWNTNFLVIDVARDNVIGTWQWGIHTSARSYLTIRVPLHVKACFDVSKALLERHPLLPLPHAEV